MARIIVKEPSRKREERKEYYVPNEEHDYHTDFGTINKEALKKCGVVVFGKETFRIYPATFADQYTRLRRGVQIITPKDLGLMMAETGIDRDTVVLDIGFGSGAVTAYLSRIAAKVYAYDVEKHNLDQGLKNLEELDTPKRYDVKLGDAYNPDTIAQENEIDVFILDVPEPWRALATAKKALKQGGWLVGYTPCITQAMQLVDALDGSWALVKTCELIEREWKVGGQAVRPVTRDFGHSAFLTFVRKVS